MKKNTILRFITLLMSIMFVIGACAVDSIPNTIAVIMVYVPMGWWFLFLLANPDVTIEQVLGKWGRD